MRRLSLSLAAALALGAATAQAAPAGLQALTALQRIERATGLRPAVVWRARHQVPRLIAGQLSQSTTARPTDAASRFLTTHPELVRAPISDLRVERTLTIRGGHVLRYRQWHQGLPVFRSLVAVTVDAQGVVRSLTSSTHEIVPQDLRPSLDRAAALRSALRETAVAGWTTDPARAVLGLLPTPGGVALAYRVDLPAVPALLSAPRLFIDAHDGRVLRRESRIWFAKKGKVYLPNPIVNPTPTEVDMTWLPDNAMTLESTVVRALNCVDNHNVTAVSLGGFSINIHLCDEIHNAQADGNFDFLFEPDDSTVAKNQDAFAEVQMFYHVNKINDFYTSLGFTGLVPSDPMDPPQLNATVNFRIPIDTANPPSDIFAAIQAAQDPNGALYPFDNAFFLDKASASDFLARERDSMVFGQGTGADFSYDGDVIYHEFGHAVVASTAKLIAGAIDDYGLDSAPGAMNEGYADYFAAALSESSKVGEYAGSSLPAGQASGAIRDLVNNDVCPNHLWGEVHQDSQAFSAGLWQARQALDAGSRPTYDAAVFAAMAALAEDANFEEAATATVAQVNTRLGASAASATETIFQNRGMIGCNNRVVDYASPRQLAFVEGTASVELSPYVPGYTQLKFELPAGKNELVVSYVPSSGLASPEQLINFGAAPDLRLIVRKDQPIQFTYNGNAIANVGDFGEATPADTGQAVGNSTIWEARYGGDLTPGTYYLMIVNRGQGQGVIRSLTVTSAFKQSTTDGGTTTPDAGTATPDAGTSVPDAGTGVDGGTTGGGKSGGCSAAGGGSGLFGILFALLALPWRRRRR